MHKYRPVTHYSAQVQRNRRPRPRLRLAAAQILGFLLMVVSSGAIAGVVTTSEFQATVVEIHGAQFTGGDIIRSILGLDTSTSLFRIQTDRAAELLARLPAVEWASVRVVLPDKVVVELRERTPSMVWAIGPDRYVVDREGFLFGLVDPSGNPIPSDEGPLPTPGPEIESPTPTASATSTSGASAAPSPTRSPTAEPTAVPTPTPAKPTAKPGKGKPTPKPTPIPTPTATPSPTMDPSLVPSIAPPPSPEVLPSGATPGESYRTVFDRRDSDAKLTFGDSIDPINLDAGYRLAGLMPADVGSSADSLAVVVDDVHGFTLSPQPAAWVAEFGFYVPTVRKPSVVPIQVRDLRSALLRWGEDRVAWLRLVADVSNSGVNTVITR